jgi:hypothetical protein
MPTKYAEVDDSSMAPFDPLFTDHAQLTPFKYENYRDLEIMLSTPQSEFVSVASSNSTHPSVITKTPNQMARFFLEKDDIDGTYNFKSVGRPGFYLRGHTDEVEGLDTNDALESFEKWIIEPKGNSVCLRNNEHRNYLATTGDGKNIIYANECSGSAKSLWYLWYPSNP